MKTSFVSLRREACAVVLVALAFALGCQRQPQPSHSEAFDAFVSSFIESSFAANPTFGVWAGRHEFDGKLPDWSPAALTKEVARLRAERDRALAFAPATLDERQRFERDYLISRIDADLFWLESAEWPYKNPEFYSGSLDPDVYVSRDYAPLADRMRSFVAYARAIPTAAQHIRNNLRIPLPRTYAEFGRNTFGGLATFYANDVPKVFASVADPQLQTEFRAANETAIKAMRELGAWFDEQRASANEDFPLGPELFLKMLRDTEGVEVSLEQLQKTGREDLERNLAMLREACNAFARGKTIPECVANVQRGKPEGGAVEGARRQLTGLKAFLLEENIVSIPGPEEALVAEAPPYRRLNYAYISIPGPYEKGLPSTYYISPPDPTWSPQERAAYIRSEAELMFTSAHEVWPGHFLQFLHSNRATSKFGQLFGSYAFAEGWAHYAEEMMRDMGVGGGTPQVRVAQLLQALVRDARFLSAVGLHTGRMSVEESERMFREEAFSNPGNSRQQAARGTYDPAYLNYTLGKLMIRKLREDWTASRGGRVAWRAFHDQFLSYGAPPIPLIRAAMLGPNAGPPL